MSKFLLAKDTINGAEGNIFITRDGKQYEVASVKKVTATINVLSEQMGVIGTRLKQEKPKGVEQKGKGTIYYGSNLFTDMVLDYAKKGQFPLFDMQLTNDDPATTLGRQTFVLYGCQLIGEIPIVILDSDETMLNYDFEFSYTTAERLEKFKEPEILGGNN